jgi:hypothetical protein
MSTATSFGQDRIRRAIVIRVPRRCVVYALLDPREPKHFRYVGHAFDTRQRLLQHIRSGAVSARRNTRKGRWISGLLAHDILPQLIILENDVHPDQALHREDHWIKYLLRVGHNLTNTQPDGGRSGFLNPLVGGSNPLSRSSRSSPTIFGHGPFSPSRAAEAAHRALS